MRARSFASVAVAACFACIALSASEARAALTQVASFGSNPGNLTMFEQVPAGAAAPMPLVVVLHGCGQTHTYADASGIVALADELGVAVIAVEQKTANNSQGCFNWFVDGDITRDEGEALSVKQMVDDVKARHDIDASRVFVTGVSSGGAMAVVLLATYPDVFSAGAVFAGIAYRCGLGVSDAFTCMSGGPERPQDEWASFVFDAAPAVANMPRISIWHGTDDGTVSAFNSDDLVAQWTGVHALSLTPSSTSTAGLATRQTFGGASPPLVENVRIAGMDHGTPVNPGSGAGQCGIAGGFLIDVDICASLEALAFFGVVDDQDPPVGEGEGEGEGEGDGNVPAEGEGEGEGDGGAGEGEGEGDGDDDDDDDDDGGPGGCTSARGADNTSALLLLALLGLGTWAWAWAYTRRRHQTNER